MNNDIILNSIMLMTPLFMLIVFAVIMYIIVNKKQNNIADENDNIYKKGFTEIKTTYKYDTTNRSDK